VPAAQIDFDEALLMRGDSGHDLLKVDATGSAI
jgi:hypothetical protein